MPKPQICVAVPVDELAEIARLLTLGKISRVEIAELASMGRIQEAEQLRTVVAARSAAAELLATARRRPRRLDSLAIAETI